MVQTEEGPCWFECSYYGGREFTGIDAIAWPKRLSSLGAGEIFSPAWTETAPSLV